MPSITQFSTGACIPLNKRHQFGSKVCDSILSDEKKNRESVKLNVTRAMEAPFYAQLATHLAPRASQLSQINTLSLETKNETE